MCVAHLDSVSFNFPGSAVPLLVNINVLVDAGEVVQLAGPNGCGKSTLLALLAGRLSPTTGRVYVLNSDPRRASRAPAIGVVSEPFHPEQGPLPTNLTGQEVLTWLEILDGVRPPDIDLAAKRLQLDEALLARPIRLLSKGERQRMLLLAVLLRSPTLLLADEPLEGLDRESRQLIGETLHAYAQARRGAVLWVSHHLADTLLFADRLLVVEDRTVIEQSRDRYDFCISAPSGPTMQVSAPSLYSLPEILAHQFHGETNLRVDIRDKVTTPGEVLSCDD